MEWPDSGLILRDLKWKKRLLETLCQVDGVMKEKYGAQPLTSR